MKYKLYRDKVISSTDKGDLVRVYIKYLHSTTINYNQYYYTNELLLAEFPPKKADKIIKLWNNK